MWILSLLPDSILLYVVNTVLIVGAVGSFLSFFAINRLLRWFPAVAPYHLILQIVSAVLLVAGIYFKGGYSVEMMWRERVAELEEKIKIAEDKSKDANEELSKAQKQKVKIVKEVQVVIQDRIVEKEKVIDAECKIAPEAISILNDAAKNQGGKK